MLTLCWDAMEWRSGGVLMLAPGRYSMASLRFTLRYEVQFSHVHDHFG